MPLPTKGTPAESIFAELKAMQADDVDWRGGRVFSLAYFAGDDVYDVAKRAYTAFLSTNALNVGAFPSLRRMQNEIVAIIAELLHGGDAAAGFMTSGGTESLLLAVKAARERGRQRGIERPNMVLPASAHAAFEKGAAYFGVTSRRVPVRDDFRADPEAMAAAIDADTVLLVASAPQYPQGVIDPVAPIAALAAARGINCHVDACMGGITLPMLARLGVAVPPFDFRVPGVTSISVDLHKYGYTAKGASVLVHRNRGLRRDQTFSTENWLGGLYASSGILGTKGGGAIAAAWAVFQYLGEEGYLRLTRQARAAAEQLVAGLRGMPEVDVLGELDATLVAFRLREIDTFAVGAALRRRGWYLDQQQPPPSLHATVHAGHAATIEPLLADLRIAIDEVRASGGAGLQQAYGSVD